MRYIHQMPEWPAFQWDADTLTALLAAVRYKQGVLMGRMQSLGFPVQAEASLETLTLDVVKSSAIEGEMLDTQQVRTSLARRLGIDIGGLAPVNRHVEGIVAMMLDATQHCEKPLTQERLFAWHAALFPTGYSGMRRITTGAWRTAESGAMQVVSGAIGREKVHFEAPDAQCLEAEMHTFLTWFNAENDLDPVLKTGLAHLWFITIHPFEDGNGRIARAIADCALSRADASPQRFYSMSAQIEQERDAYYVILEQSQKGTLDITAWLSWFIGCLHRAVDGAEATLALVLHKAKIWEHVNICPLNKRQHTVITRLLDNFEGKLTTSKYAKLAKCSPDTALRDIKELVAYGVLWQCKGGGRSTSYDLTL